jgi:DNA-binding beta-propeller fold protein YncE
MSSPTPVTPTAAAVLAAAACAIGCSAPDGSALEAKEVVNWSIPADGPTIPAPRAVTVDPRTKEVIVLDTAGRVLVFDEVGALVRTWRMPESEAGNPEGVLVLADGRIAVADTHYSRVVFFDTAGRQVGVLGRRGRGHGEFIYPVGIAQDDGENIYVCEYGTNDRVQKFTREGEFVLAFGSFGTEAAAFQRPSGIVWRRGGDGAGHLIVADAINNRLQVFTDEGKYLGALGSPEAPLTFRFPYDLALDGRGGLYIVEYLAGRVTKVALEGTRRGVAAGHFGRTGSGTGEFRTPWGIAVDTAGRVRVADTGNRRIVTLLP